MTEIIVLSLGDIVTTFVDLFIFSNISEIYHKKDEKIAVWIIGFIVLLMGVLSPNWQFMNFGVTIIEILIIYVYFTYIKKNDKRLILGACLTFGLVDIIILTFEVGLEILFSDFFKADERYTLNIFINVVAALVIFKYRNRIQNSFLDRNSSILLGALAYIYVSGYAIDYLIFDTRMSKEVVIISLGLLVFQAVFAFLLYMGVVKIQKEIQTEQQQKRMEAEIAQLKEYSNYLDKNEDELRNFKHDYQDILNGLRISAEEGDTKAVVQQLVKYTDSQVDDKSLRKYQDVNHIHVDELKSIAITKLAKLYNEEIPYSFGCNVEIYKIPRSVNILDIVRIIGITFNNAIEESRKIKQTVGKENAKVDAMYYQEDGNFEFKIRNRIAEDTERSSDILSQEGYSTKKDHAGIGLANIKRIESKYEECMLINYGFEDGWFTFDLEIMPDNENTEEE